MSSPATGLRYTIRLMEAGLTLGLTATSIPEDVSPEALAQVLIAELNKKGITYGLDKEAILRVFKDRVLDEEVEVAHGTPAQPGRDAEVELLLLPPSFTAGEDEGGRIDYKNVENVSPVKAGDIISRKTPSDPGQPGTNVFGKPVRPPAVRDARHPAGRNTQISDDGLELRAAVDGFLRWNGDKIDVLELYSVPGDVDLRSGNVKYDRDVEILGSVRPGFQVTAGGDVRIYGSVEGTVTAGGGIIVSGGVMGSDGNPAVVTAEGDVQIGRGRFAKIESKTGRVIANFAVEHSEIRAAGDLILRAGPAMSCVVEVGGKIDVSNVSTRSLVGQASAPAAAITQTSSSNRRQYLRVTLSPPPAVQVHGDMPSDVRPGVILDLSAGGVRLRLPEHTLKEGDRYRLQFTLEGVSGTMWGEAEVVRECEPRRTPNGHSYGLKFVQIEPAVREAIARFCLAEDLRQHRANRQQTVDSRQ
ncbi:MAG TPA: flagellar assembly protein A [Chloroflexota bacterium]|nr:flagellar assembly protein A [Chloroflexota bacterium]